MIENGQQYGRTDKHRKDTSVDSGFQSVIMFDRHVPQLDGAATLAAFRDCAFDELVAQNRQLVLARIGPMSIVQRICRGQVPVGPVWWASGRSGWVARARC